MEKVLITGAAHRLGSLIAGDLAAAGCFIWIHYRTHEQEAFQLKKEIREKGGKAECVYSDLEKIDDIRVMLDEIAGSESASLTTLINNASVFSSGTIQSTTTDEWNRTMNINLRSVWFLSTQFAEHFPTAKRIITIGDASTKSVFAEHAVYGLSKYALKYLTKQMASAFSPRIRVNLLSPGFVLPGEKEPEEVWKKRTVRALCDNSDIIDSVLRGIRFLMEDPGMTGSEIVIDNGLQIH